MSHNASVEKFKKKFPTETLIPSFDLDSQVISWEILTLNSYREYFDVAFPLAEEALAEFKEFWGK